jgi:hypothetical protein
MLKIAVWHVQPARQFCGRRGAFLKPHFAGEAKQTEAAACGLTETRKCEAGLIVLGLVNTKAARLHVQWQRPAERGHFPAFIDYARAYASDADERG